MGKAFYDDNNRPTLIAVSSTDGKTAVELYADPVTHKLLISSEGSSFFEARNDTTSDTNLVYLGKALPGSATSDAAWQIKRYNKSAGYMSFADDETTFTKTWDARASYSY